MAKIMKKAFIGVLALFLVVGVHGVMAQQPSPSALPSGKTYFKLDGVVPTLEDIPFVQDMIKSGASLRYMGERSGLQGFLILKEGQIQMLYVTPDKKSVLMGALFADDGQLVTPMQIAALSEKDKEVAAIMDGSARQNIDVIRAGVQQGGMAEIPGGPARNGEGDQRIFPMLPASPGERLVADLKASSGVIVGNAKAPELLMVVAPDCGHCKATWKEISPAVKEGKLQVRLIPIGINRQGSEFRVAANLLRAKNPLAAWESYISGDKKALDGQPDDAALRAILANREMTDRWNIMGTPYLVYRDAKNTIKIVQGHPSRMAAVLADLIR